MFIHLILRKFRALLMLPWSSVVGSFIELMASQYASVYVWMEHYTIIARNIIGNYSVVGSQVTFIRILA
jgi:hypothetical protein